MNQQGIAGLHLDPGLLFPGFQVLGVNRLLALQVPDTKQCGHVHQDRPGENAVLDPVDRELADAGLLDQVGAEPVVHPTLVEDVAECIDVRVSEPVVLDRVPVAGSADIAAVLTQHPLVTLVKDGVGAMALRYSDESLRAACQEKLLNSLAIFIH